MKSVYRSAGIFSVLLCALTTGLFSQTLPLEREDIDKLIGEELTIADADSYSLTVEEAVALALENNLSLVREAASLRTDKRTMDTAWNVLIPSVKATSTLTRFHEEVGTSPNSYMGTLSAGLNFSLTLTPQLWYAFRATMYNYEQGLLAQEDARLGIATNVKKQFYTLLTLQEQIKILEQQQRSYEKRFDQASTNYDFGLADEYTKLSAQVALENFKPQVEIARDGYEQAMLGFKLSLGINLNSKLNLNGKIEITPRTYNADKLIDSYILNRLDIQTLVSNLNSLDNSRKLAFSAYLPSLTLGYGLDQDLSGDPWSDFSLSPGDWENGSTHRVLSLTLSMSLSELLPVSGTSNDIKEIDDSREALRASLAQALQGAELEILTAVQTVNKSVQVIKAKELNVELAQRAYQLAEESYNAGGMSLLDVEDAEDKLQEARFELLSEKVNYISGIVDLESAINRSVDDVE